jgi:hypothetical protein
VAVRLDLGQMGRAAVSSCRGNQQCRAMNQPDEVFLELISAYLDGELSPDEAAYVEHLAGTRSEHHRALEEMRRVVSDMRMLPTYRLDPEFPQRVLTAARQAETLSAPDGPLALSQAAGRRPAAVGAHARRWRWGPPVLAVATAASVLALLGIAQWMTTGDSRLRDDRVIAQHQTSPAPMPQAVDETLPPVDREPSEAGGPNAPPETLPSHSTASDLGRRAAGHRHDPPKIAPSSPRRAPPDGAAWHQPPSNLPTADQASPEGKTATREGPVAAIGAQSPHTQAGKPAGGAAKLDERLQQFMLGPGRTAPKMLLVIDVQVTATGWNVGRFEQLLREHSITFDTSLPVSSDAEASLLASRFFEPKEQVETASQDAATQTAPFTLVYVVGRGGAIDALWQRIKQDEIHFTSATLDMALHDNDVALFRQLQQLDRLAGGLHTPADPSPNVAHRLVLPPAWDGMPAKRTAPPRGYAESGPAAPPGGPAMSNAPEGHPMLWGGDLEVETLFVIRDASAPSR